MQQQDASTTEPMTNLVNSKPLLVEEHSLTPLPDFGNDSVHINEERPSKRHGNGILHMRKPVKAKTENTGFGYVIVTPQTGIALVVVKWARRS